MDNNTHPNEHRLKCWPEAFQQKWNGNKSWEYRINDRGFQEGDLLITQEWNQEANQYTGREITERVSYILHGPDFGIPLGYCVMSTVDVGFRPMFSFENILNDAIDELKCHALDPFDFFERTRKAAILAFTRYQSGEWKDQVLDYVKCEKCGREKIIDTQCPFNESGQCQLPTRYLRPTPTS